MYSLAAYPEGGICQRFLNSKHIHVCKVADEITAATWLKPSEGYSTKDLEISVDIIVHNCSYCPRNFFTQCCI